MEQETIVSELPNGYFVQWSTDNVDHNSVTLDGKRTFHAILTQRYPLISSRLFDDSANLNNVCEAYTVLDDAKIVDNDFYYELLWLSSRNVSKNKAQNPNGSGFIQEVISPNIVFPQNTENY